MTIINSRPIRSAIGALLLLIASVFALGAPAANAGRAVCRTDPIVTLSDGTVVTLYADLETDLSNISSVDYTLHAPAGVTVVSVVHPIAATADLESFTFVNDGTPAKMSATTVGTTRDGHKSKVTAYMDVDAPGNGKIQSVKKDGDSGTSLKTEVKIGH